MIAGDAEGRAEKRDAFSEDSGRNPREYVVGASKVKARRAHSYPETDI